MDDDGYIPLSAVFRHAHCPRQAYLFHAEGAHADNRFTAEGNALHQRVTEGEDETRPGIRITRSHWLVSHRLRVRGIADVVEWRGDIPLPVEYKRGGRKGRCDEQAQLAVQALCLAEMIGRPVTEGSIYHHQTRRREMVAITPELLAEAERLVVEVRSCLEQSRPPPPDHGSWCASCSLLHHCLPQVVASRDRLADRLRRRLESGA